MRQGMGAMGGVWRAALAATLIAGLGWPLPALAGIAESRAWFEALKVKRHAARARAQQFGWGRATALFVSFLVLFPPRQRKPRPSPLNAAAAVRSLPGIEVVRLSHKRHPAVE